MSRSTRPNPPTPTAVIPSATAPPIDRKVSKASGNLAFYLYRKQFRQASFLNRNLNVVVGANLRAKRALREPTTNPKPARTVPNPKPGEKIATILERLSSGTRKKKVIDDKAFLKIEPTGIRAGETQTEGDSAQETEFSRVMVEKLKQVRMEEASTRCRCEVEIHTQGRILFVNSEMCTISNGTITADDPFYLSIKKLFIPTTCHTFGIGKQYYLLLRLIPELSPELTSLGADDASFEAFFSFFPDLPASKTFPLFSVSKHLSLRNPTHHSISLFIAWAVPSSPPPLPPRIKPRRPTNSFVLPPQDPTPNIVSDTLTIYRFSPSFQVYTLPSHRCALCNGLPFPTLTTLHLHLLLSHPSFSFTLSRYSHPPPGIISNHARYLHQTEITIELSQQATLQRASDSVKDPRHFYWVRPAAPFSLTRLLRGDIYWRLDSKPLTHHSYHNYHQRNSDDRSQSPTQFTAWSTAADQYRARINLRQPPPLPRRPKRRFRVPKPLNDLTGPVLLRSGSKRFLIPGEELVEASDDDEEGHNDTEWLLPKHHVTLESFGLEVPERERRFMKLWDSYVMGGDEVLADCYLPVTVMRFGQKYRDLMEREGLRGDWWKFLVALVGMRRVDAEVVRVGMELVGAGPPSEIKDAEGDVEMVEVEVGDSQTVGLKEGKINVIGLGEENGVRKVKGGGFCECGKGWDRTDMLLCEGMGCVVRQFHSSCQGVPRGTRGWKCRGCREKRKGEREGCSE